MAGIDISKLTSAEILTALQNGEITPEEVQGFSKSKQVALTQGLAGENETVIGDQLNLTKNKAISGPNKILNKYKPDPRLLLDDTRLLKDTHQNTYILTDEDTLKNLLSESKQYKDKLDTDGLNKYNNFINKIKYNADGSIDIKAVDTLKAFLYLRKLVKYEGNIPAETEPRFNENSKLLGLYAKKYENFKNAINCSQELKESMLNFKKGIYDSNIHFTNIVSADELEKTKTRQKEMLNEMLKKYDIPKEELSSLHINDNFNYSNRTFTCDIDNEWNNWELDVLIQKDGLVSNGVQSSREVITLHELYHVRQATPGETTDYSDDLVELGATLDTIIREDELHKLANGIPINEEVEYPNKITFNGKQINVGLIANTFRNIMQKYNLETYEEAMLTQEGTDFIKNNFLK